VGKGQVQRNKRWEVAREKPCLPEKRQRKKKKRGIKGEKGKGVDSSKEAPSYGAGNWWDKEGGRGKRQWFTEERGETRKPQLEGGACGGDSRDVPL